MNHWKNKELPELGVVTPIFPPDIGGPASYIYELCQRLKGDFAIRGAAFCEGKALLIKNVEIHSINPRRFTFFGRQWRLWKALKKYLRNANTLYIQGPVVVGLLSVLFAKRFGIKSVMKFVGDIAWEEASREGKTALSLDEWLDSPKKDFKSKMLRAVQKYGFKNVGVIVVPSMYLKNLLMKYYEVPEAKIHMIYNAFDYRSVQRKFGDRAFKLMTAGRFVPHKHIGMIIEAMTLLPDEYCLNIFGEGPEEKNLLSKVEELNLGARVKFRGQISHQELSKEMEKHDMFVLYSSYEGLPHVVLEAFAARCPVVASDISGTREVAINGKTAMLAEGGNPKRLAEAVRNLSWDRKKRERFSMEAVKLLKSEFSWNTHIEKLKEIL